MFNEVSLLLPQAVRLFVSEVTWGCGNGPGVAFMSNVYMLIDI